VDFVIDATMTFPIPNPEKAGEELGGREIEERTSYALRGRFAGIVRAAELVRELADIEVATPT
jgi:hypothetical protein